MMTNLEFVEKLKNIEKRDTGYSNKYPYNLCYYDGEKMTADCFNLIKGLIWDESIDENYTVGRFAKPNFSTGLGDWTANQILEHCEEVSHDFSDVSKIPVGAFLVWGNGGHAGVHIGYGDVIEATKTSAKSWNVQGVTISHIGENGLRVRYTERYKRDVELGSWTSWAKLPYIKYVDDETETDPKADDECESCKIIYDEPLTSEEQEEKEQVEVVVAETENEETPLQCQIGKVNWVKCLILALSKYKVQNEDNGMASLIGADGKVQAILPKEDIKIL